MGTYLPCTQTLDWPGMGVGLLTPEISFPNFYPLHVDERPARSTPAPLLPVWMGVVSLILKLSDFQSTQFLTVVSDGYSVF